jgi:APA family basic amino acid/polyamine antiporter
VLTEPPARERPVEYDSGVERHIKFPGAAMLVVGNVIGSGIFLTSGLMLSHLNSGGELLFLWLMGGLLSLCGGFTYAELGAMYPRSGGLYIYLAEAYGPRIGFMFGWASLAIILTGQIAGVAVGFAEYLSYFIPGVSPSRVLWSIRLGTLGVLSVSAGQIVAIASIALLAAVNMLNLHGSRNTAVYLTALKVIALVALAVFAFSATHHLGELNWKLDLHASHVPVLALAMIPVLYSYEGWSYLAFAASEVQKPGRNLPRALLTGIGMVTTLYVVVNLAYLSALPVESLSGVERVGEAAATASAGSLGAAFVSLTALVSTLGGNAALIFVAARVFFAMSRQGTLFRSFGILHPTRGTPDRAVVLVCGWSALLVLTGSYEQLYTFVTFAVILFSVAGGAAVFVLRRTQRQRPRPYLAFGYPWVPGAFVLVMAGLAINTLVGAPVQSSVGLALVALGWPLYSLMRRHAARESTAADRAPSDLRA